MTSSTDIAQKVETEELRRGLGGRAYRTPQRQRHPDHADREALNGAVNNQDLIVTVEVERKHTQPASVAARSRTPSLIAGRQRHRPAEMNPIVADPRLT